MFDDDLPKAKSSEFPRTLEAMSISELEEYVQDLQGEIKRVEQNIVNKKASQEAAASVFKS